MRGKNVYWMVPSLVFLFASASYAQKIFKLYGNIINEAVQKAVLEKVSFNSISVFADAEEVLESEKTGVSQWYGWQTLLFVENILSS